MSTMPKDVEEDALDSWLTDLNGGESSMRKLRKKLAAKADARMSAVEEKDEAAEDSCPTCHGSTAGHGGYVLRPIR
jgi:hypothetical protein